MLATTLGLLLAIAATPSTSSQTAAERLSAELSSGGVGVVVDDPDADVAACHATRLVLTPQSTQQLKKALASPELPTALPLKATRHGVDDRRRRCAVPTTVTIAAAARRPLPPTGTAITVSVVGEGFSIDGSGVVVPCRKNELAVGVDVVCARMGTGKVLSGILGDNNALVVTASLPGAL